MGITPDSYGRRGIKNDKAAEQVLNAKFMMREVKSIPSFTDSCEQIVKESGFNTFSEFKSAAMKSYDDLVEIGQLDKVKAVRDSIPDPDNDTLLQKVVDEDTMKKYLGGEYKDVGGSIAKLSDVKDLKTYTQVYNGLRLDYYKTTFPNPGSENATMYAIRFTTDDAETMMQKSVRSDVLNNAEWKPPYTGTGFLSSADELDFSNFNPETNYPANVISEGKQVIPEYIGIRDANGKALSLSKGAEMYKITESGEEILYAVFDTQNEMFRLIGE